MLPAGASIYLATVPVDLRAGFDVLSGHVKQALGADPRTGDLYAFLNRKRTRVKILFYDRTGYCLLYKRLDRGTFPLPVVIEPGASRVTLSSAQLEVFMRGLELVAKRARKKATPTTH